MASAPLGSPQAAARARELGLDRGGRYAAVLDAATVPPGRARPIRPAQWQQENPFPCDSIIGHSISI
jgi:hypothetical protein